MLSKDASEIGYVKTCGFFFPLLNPGHRKSMIYFAKHTDTQHTLTHWKVKHDGFHLPGILGERKNKLQSNNIDLCVVKHVYIYVVCVCVYTILSGVRYARKRFIGICFPMNLNLNTQIAIIFNFIHAKAIVCFNCELICTLFNNDGKSFNLKLYGETTIFSVNKIINLNIIVTRLHVC